MISRSNRTLTDFIVSLTNRILLSRRLRRSFNLFLVTLTSYLSLDTSISHSKVEFLLCAALDHSGYIEIIDGIILALKVELVWWLTVSCWNHLLKFQECCKPFIAYNWLWWKYYITETSKNYKSGLIFLSADCYTLTCRSLCISKWLFKCR